MSSKYPHKIIHGHFQGQNPFLLLRTSLDILLQYPVVLYPTALLALIQLFIIEIIYFAPQYPLSLFFSPLIRQIWSEEYLHYPLNLVLLPKMFYYAQIFVYLFLGSFLLALSVKVISVLNEHSRVNMRFAIKETFRSYVHIFMASMVSFVIFQIFAKVCVSFLDTFIKHNPLGQSQFFLNRSLLWIIPYVQFIVGILATTVVAYLMPIIIIDKEKFFKALLKNFKILAQTFPLTFMFVAVPTMLYLPVLTVRNNISTLMNMIGPEVQILIIIAGLAISMIIDLLIITSATIFYLFMRENS